MPEQSPTRAIFDAHFHVVDPKFELTPNQGYVPSLFTCSDYRQQADRLGVRGGAIIAGSFQRDSQAYLLDALDGLGPRFVGVALLSKQAPESEITALDERGVRAIRFNLYRLGSEQLPSMEYLARKVFEVAHWHVEIYANAGDLRQLAPLLRSLPQVVVDHLGLSQEALPTLLSLVERGAKVKASGFGRFSGDVVAALKAVASANPSALMFGTDLPSTRAPRPFVPSDIDLIDETLGPEMAGHVLYDNAVGLYHPKAMPRPVPDSV